MLSATIMLEIGELVKYPAHNGKIYEFLGEFEVAAEWDSTYTWNVARCRNVQTGEVKDFQNLKHFYCNTDCLSKTDRRIEILERQLHLEKKERKRIAKMFSDAQK